jgi:hypothetical protein
MTSKVWNKRLVGYRYTRNSAIPDVPNAPWVYAFNAFVFQNTGIGADNPFYRSLIRQHESAVNVYSATLTRLQIPHGYGKKVQRRFVLPHTIDFVDEARGMLGNFAQPSKAIPDQTPTNRAKARFVSRANSLLSPFSGGVFLGELREAIELVRHPAKSLWEHLTLGYLPRARKTRRKFIKNPNKPTRKGVQNANKALAGLWLEYSFGAQPLVADINNAAEALADFVSNSVGLKPVNAQDESKQLISLEENLLVGTNNLDWKYSRLTTDTTSVRIYGVVRTAPAGGVSYARELGSFRIQDFVPTVWELIPYSFLVDYFTNIGDMIAAASFCQSKLAWVGITQRAVRRQYVVLSDWPGTNDPEQIYRLVASGPASMEVTSIDRYIPSTLVPDLSIRCPGVGSMKWLNVAALAVQKIF